MIYLYAFLVGGIICGICQIFIDKTKLTPARILVALVVLGVILTATGMYQKLVDFAGCGATVPLLGFGYSLAMGTQKAINEIGLLGIVTGGITGAAGGITVAIVIGFTIALIFKPKPK
ncbi:MAG: stage V sporulation protein AE [Clostridia bacterium]